MMLKISGHSDDIVSLSGLVDDEIGAYDKPVAIRIGDARGGVIVTMHYAPDKASAAVWRASVEQIDEDVPVPWAIHIKQDHAYSVAVIVECPAGTPIDWERER